jgi:hypothetical protein
MSERGEAFVVGLDREAVLRRREVIRSVQLRGAWVTLAIGAVGIVAAVAAMIAFRGAGLWPFALLLIAAMVPLVLSTVLVLRLDAERQLWYAANELQPVAMRMSPKALELACQGAAYPVVLPWKAVKGFRQEKLFGQYALELELAPGVAATTAGVRGLDQPSVRSIVKPNPLLRPTGLFRSTPSTSRSTSSTRPSNTSPTAKPESSTDAAVVRRSRVAVVRRRSGGSLIQQGRER